MIENTHKFLAQKKKNYLYKIEKLKFLNSEMLEIKNVLQFNHPNLILISPSINELYTFDEIKLILQELNFGNITRTVNARNHHIIANLNG